MARPPACQYSPKMRERCFVYGDVASSFTPLLCFSCEVIKMKWRRGKREDVSLIGLR